MSTETPNNCEVTITRETLFWFSASLFLLCFVAFPLAAYCPKAIWVKTPPIWLLSVYWSALSLYAGHLITQKPAKKKMGQYMAWATLAEIVLVAVCYIFHLEIKGHAIEVFPVNMSINAIVIMVIFVGRTNIKKDTFAHKFIDLVLSKVPVKVVGQSA